jgi:hypothetical protein
MRGQKNAWAIIPMMLVFALACNLTASTPRLVDRNGTTSEAPGSTEEAPAPTDSAKPATTNTATATPEFTGAAPGDPPARQWWMDDISEKPSGNGGNAAGGDNYAESQYERPWTKDMAYRADLDILGGQIAKDSAWWHVTILLAGQNKEGKMAANYGVELDLNLDGRGEFVIWTQPPYGTQWTRANTKIYGTSSHQVGGPHPILSDAPWSGATYDKIIFDGATDFTNNDAWVRISAGSPNNINIAFNMQVVGAPAKFAWSVWADDGIKDPAKFDYNDTFTKADAGAPYTAYADYPPKAIFAVDNTCRMWYGWDPSPSDAFPGSCLMPATPTPKPTNTPHKTFIHTKTPTIGLY